MQRDCSSLPKSRARVFLVEMPRICHCKTCGQQHGPPTGKHCRNARIADITGVQELLPVLMEIKNKLNNVDEKVTNVDERVKKVEEKQLSGGDVVSGQLPVDSEGSDDGDVEEMPEQMGATGGEDYVTPAALRKDIRAMRKAAERIERMQDTDSDDGLEDITTKKTSRNGKKSGTMLVASEVVKSRIDWPHMYVTRLTGGGREGVPYKQLRIEEFVYGFLLMLESPKCTWDKDTMLVILRMLMRDTMDFAWENARAFYEMVGHDVEAGVRKWTDSDEIFNLRLLHSRVSLTEKKEQKEGKKPNSYRAPATPARPCALYQRGTCEHNRDHPPFSHVCAYCYRATGMMCRHADTECIRKNSDDSKNGPKRE